MPYKSLKQMSWAFANKKPWAKKWASKTSIKSLPLRVKKKKKK